MDPPPSSCEYDSYGLVKAETLYCECSQVGPLVCKKLTDGARNQM